MKSRVIFIALSFGLEQMNLQVEKGSEKWEPQVALLEKAYDELKCQFVKGMLTDSEAETDGHGGMCYPDRDKDL